LSIFSLFIYIYFSFKENLNIKDDHREGRQRTLLSLDFFEKEGKRSSREGEKAIKKAGLNVKRTYLVVGENWAVETLLSLRFP
jgi:hypothetical protein